MADDQNQKSFDSGAAQNKASTIDDLVRELSKSNTNQPPPNLPGVKIEIKPPITGPQPTLTRPEPPRPIQPTPPKPTSPPPIPAGLSGPIGMARPQPPGAPATGGQAKPSPVQEYKSSIRTMGEDITSIKSGQKPAGVDIPRKVAPEMPKAPIPGAPQQPISSIPTGPRPAVGLGKAERSSGLPTPAVPQKPGMPLKPPTIQPSAPITQPSISVPGQRKGWSTTFYLLIAGILVIGGFLYWFLVLRTTEPGITLSPTPTPTQTVTPTPVIKNLSDIFEGTPVNFEVVSSGNLGQDFKTFIGTLSVAGREFTKINLVETVDNVLIPTTFLDVFDADLILYPADFRDNVLDSTVVVYGQSEAFNADGSINFNVQNLKKTAFVSRVRDGAAVEAMMRDWELTLAKDLADYLLIADVSKEESINFLDNFYRDTSIRYKNFPLPDVTVDYAVVEAAGQSYLIIAGSREAMYAAIDDLLEQ